MFPELHFRPEAGIRPQGVVFKPDLTRAVVKDSSSELP